MHQQKMISPEIKDCWSEDIPNLYEWQPDDPQFVDIWFSVAIGMPNENGADNFQIHLVSQAQLPHIKNMDYILVIPYFESWSKVMEILNYKVQECQDLNWIGISAQLEKLFFWEYHNFKP